MLVIADRLRLLRNQKDLSQGDMESRTGLLRCYISRVENGHTVPSIETLEKLARALDLPLYQLLYDGEEPPAKASPARSRSKADSWGMSGKDGRFLRKLVECLAHLTDEDRNLLFSFAENIAARKKNKRLG